MKQVHYIILLFHLLYTQVNGQFLSSNLPIVLIETNGQEIQDDPRIIASLMTICNPYGERNYLPEGEQDFIGLISIELRGNTSLNFPKKQYAFEIQYDSGENCDFGLLGLPTENDWILSGPYSDKSLIRNILAYQIAHEMGQYAARTALCELVLNTEYQGVYVLTEKIKRDRNRINIAEMSVDDTSGDAVTGGYIFKKDRADEECTRWQTEITQLYLQLEYPDCENLIQQQLEYSQDYINRFEASLFSDNYTDSLSGYLSFIDLNSFLDYYFVNEIAKNVDAYRLSTFLYKDRDSRGGKLIMGPVWDFDIAFGNVDYGNGFRTDSLFAPDYPWWNRLLSDSSFNKKAALRWKYHRRHSISTERLLHIIDSLTLLLDESQERNFERWDLLGKELWPNYFVGNTYESEIEYLKSWLVNRINWLDNYFNIQIPPNSTDGICITGFYPDPFWNFYTLAFTLTEPGEVKFRFFDTIGNMIMETESQYYERGSYLITKYLGTSDYSLHKSGLMILQMEKDNRPADFLKVVRFER